MKNLIEMADKQFREELRDFYIVSKSRIDNLTHCFEDGVKRIKELTAIIAEQQTEIARLTKELLDDEQCREEDER